MEQVEIFQEATAEITQYIVDQDSMLLKGNNDLRGEIFAETIKLIIKKIKSKFKKMKQNRKIELMKNIQTDSFIFNLEAHLSLNMIAQVLRKRAIFLPMQPIAR